MSCGTIFHKTRAYNYTCSCGEMVYAADLKSVSPCGIKGSSPFRSTVYVVE